MIRRKAQSSTKRFNSRGRETQSGGFTDQTSDDAAKGVNKSKSRYGLSTAPMPKTSKWIPPNAPAHRRLFLVQGAALFVAACGGGGDSGSSPAPSPAPAPAPTPVPQAIPTINALSSVTPTALTPLSITTSGVNTTQAFAVSLKKTGSVGSISLRSIRTDASKGLIVVGLPMSIDGATGNTSDFVGTITVTQAGVDSAAVPLTIKDIPTLAELGVPLGVITRSYYLHQQISMAASLNSYQASASLPGAKTDTAALRGHLANQIQKAIYASSDVDRIMVNNSVKIPFGITPQGLTVAYDKRSLELQDRVLAVYLLAFTATPVASGAPVGQHPLASAPTEVRPEAIPAGAILGLTTALVGAGTWAGYKNQQQAKINGSAADQVLASATFAQSALLLGTTIVAVGAAAAGAPVIAAAAGAAATVLTVAGLGLAAASVGNDLYNIATHGYDAYAAKTDGERSAAVDEALKSAKLLAVDSVIGVLQAEGMGLLSSSSKSLAGTVLESIFEPALKDTVYGSGQFTASVGGLYINGALSKDSKSATDAMGELPSVNSPTGIGFMTGTATITNAQGPILSGLTGVSVGPGATQQFTSIADQAGNYSVMVPYGNPAISYPSLTGQAYDPVTGDVLTSSGVNLGALNPNNRTVAGPHFKGACIDTDAGSPDSDDPDCD